MIDSSKLLKKAYSLIHEFFPYEKIIFINNEPEIFYLLNFHGIYILYQESEIVYVGCSGNVGSRLNSHNLNFSFSKAAIIRFFEKDGILPLEAILINNFKPKFNKITQQLKIYLKQNQNMDFKEIIEKLDRGRCIR